MTQDREDWLRWRSQGVGASEIAGIVGVSPWQSPYSIWATKVGLIEPEPDSDRFEFGRRAEKMLAEWFQDKTGLYVLGEQTWCTHATESWARCTVDGFVGESPITALPDVIGVFEAKTTSEPPWDEVPAHYVAQCQWQMAVTGTTRAWVVTLHLAFGHPRFALYTLERDEVTIARLLAAGSKFWRDHVLTGTVPELDATEATTEALKRSWQPDERTTVDVEDLGPVLYELAQARERARLNEDEMRAAENIIRARLGEATDGVIGDELVVTWRPQTSTRLDGAALRRDHPDLADEYTTESTTRVLRFPSRKART